VLQTRSDRTHVTIDPASSQLVPEARIIKAEHVSCEDGLIVASGLTASTTLAPDTVLHELRDADLGTGNGVAEVLSQIGLDMGVPLDLPSLGLVDRAWNSEETADVAPLIVEGFTIERNLLVAVASCGRSTRMQAATVVPKVDSFDLDCTISCGPWQPIAQRLRLVRAAVNHYIAHREGAEAPAAWTAEGFEAHFTHVIFDPTPARGQVELNELNGSAEADSWRIFVAIHACLLREYLPPFEVWLARGQSSLWLGAFPHSVSTSLMVQLHNLIVDGLEIRRCANETCHRPFAHQRGRAEKGQLRTSGVIYCDAACANAQRQREYRRRTRQRATDTAGETRPG